jgi:SAM-dependent methyltransferase
VDDRLHGSAVAVRAHLERARHDPAHPAPFRAALLGVPPQGRDAWLDVVLGLDALPDDGPALPRGCVPYIPCTVDALLRVVEGARIGPADVFVDIGAGAGRAATLVHLLTGATAIGIEIQPELVRVARELASRFGLARVSYVEGDGAALAAEITTGTVYFLYCPFSGDRLAKVLAALETLAHARPIRVGCVDLPLPPCPWLERMTPLAGDLAVYRSSV